MSSKVRVCRDTVSSADIRRCSHSEEQQFHLWIISLTSAADVLTSLCLNFLTYKTMSNDTDGCQFLTAQNTLSIVQSKSTFLDHRHHRSPSTSKDTRGKILLISMGIVRGWWNKDDAQKPLVCRYWQWLCICSNFAWRGNNFYFGEVL